MTTDEIRQLIMANNHLGYEELKKQALEAGVPADLFEQAWQETMGNNKKRWGKKIIAITMIAVLAGVSVTWFIKNKKIDKVIVFSVVEELPKVDYKDDKNYAYNQNPEIVLNGATTEEYACGGNRVKSEIEIEKNVINVLLKGSAKKIDLESPSVCFTAFSYASLKEKLNVTEGEYILKIKLGSKTDEYQLNITKEKITTTPVKETFLELRRAESPRTPPNTIAALCSRAHYACETRESSDELCPTFYSEVDKIAKRIDDIGLTKGILGRCNEEDYTKDKCRFYRYEGDLKILDDLTKATKTYNLEHGQKADCNGAALYSVLIKTQDGHTFPSPNCIETASGYECKYN